jgi:hypothetical protein
MRMKHMVAADGLRLKQMVNDVFAGRLRRAIKRRQGTNPGPGVGCS